MDYKNAGVDIEAGYKSVELMKKHVQETMRPEVLTNLGGFSGAFSLKKFFRLTMCGNNRHFKINSQFFQHIRCLAHDRHIGVAAHYNTYFSHVFSFPLSFMK